MNMIVSSKKLPREIFETPRPQFPRVVQADEALTQGHKQHQPRLNSSSVLVRRECENAAGSN